MSCEVYQIDITKQQVYTTTSDDKCILCIETWKFVLIKRFEFSENEYSQLTYFNIKLNIVKIRIFNVSLHKIFFPIPKTYKKTVQEILV